MARVPYLTEKDLAAQNRDLLTRNLNLYRALVNSPDTARSFMALGMHIRFHMKLDARLRELAILQVGYRTRAPYEYAHHIELGRQFGVTDGDLAAITVESRGETSTLPALDRAVLSAARELTDGTQLALPFTHNYLPSPRSNRAETDLCKGIAVLNSPAT